MIHEDHSPMGSCQFHFPTTHLRIVIRTRGGHAIVEKAVDLD
jgi:hypothetical protein